MKKIGFALMLILTAVLCCPTAYAASAKKVAVYVEGDITSSERSVVNSAVMARISGSKDYVCFERNESFLRALAKEGDFQLSGDVPEKEIREVGARSGADYVIVVNVVLTEDNTYMAAKLLDLKTGQILKTTDATREGNDISVMKALATNCTYRLISTKSK